MKIELKGYHIEFLLYLIVISMALILCFTISKRQNYLKYT